MAEINSDKLVPELDWRASLINNKFEEALAKVRALELVGQQQPEIRAALERCADFLKCVREKNFDAAKKNLPIELQSLAEPDLGLSELTANSPTENSLHHALGHPLCKAEALNQMGVAAALAGDNQRARELFTASLQADPRHHRAIVNIGNLELEAGLFDSAIRHYREAIELNPNYATAHNNLAAALKRSGKLSLAVASLKKANRLEMNQSKQKNNSGQPFGGPNTAWWQNRYITIVLMVAALVFVFLLRR